MSLKKCTGFLFTSKNGFPVSTENETKVVKERLCNGKSS